MSVNSMGTYDYVTASRLATAASVLKWSLNKDISGIRTQASYDKRFLADLKEIKRLLSVLELGEGLE